jgi:hypothetical protein
MPTTRGNAAYEGVFRTLSNPHMTQLNMVVIIDGLRLASSLIDSARVRDCVDQRPITERQTWLIKCYQILITCLKYSFQNLTNKSDFGSPLGLSASRGRDG